MFIRAFLASFFFFLLLLVVSLSAEDFMNKQGIYYPPLFKRLTKGSVPLNPKTTPLPPAHIGNGDANANNLIDFGDVYYLSDNWNNSASGSIDQYQDGKINSLDFAVTAHYLPK